MKHIILAYSGGLDTSAIIPWLKDTYQCEVTAYCSNLGNLPSHEILKERALYLGAKRFIFEDLREDFCQNFVFPMVRAGAKYQNEYLLGTAIARPIIAERLAYYAQELHADGVAHGATGKGNDQLRFENSLAYLVPDISILAPWKIWDFKGRMDLIHYLKSKGFNYKGEVSPEYSVDSNIFHMSTEGGILEDIESNYSLEAHFQETAIPQTQAEDIHLHFEKGIPYILNSHSLSAHTLLEKLNEIATHHRIGKLDLVEERINGLKSRGIYLTPGGYLLHFALNCLKQICWDRKLTSTSSLLSQTYGELIYDGFWHSNLRYSIESFFNEASETLTGEVGLKLHRGQIDVLYRKSPYSLYNKSVISFEEDQNELNRLAEGFCKTVGLKQKQSGLVRKLMIQ